MTGRNILEILGERIKRCNDCLIYVRKESIYDNLKFLAWHHAISLLMGRELEKIDTLKLWKITLMRNQVVSVDGQISQRKKYNT